MLRSRINPDPEKEDTDDDRDVVRSFGKNTNIEGINNAGRAKSTTRVAVWLTIFVFLVSLTLYDLIQLVQDYISQPVDVSTTLEHENAIDFPSVTVCNRNPVSCERLKEFIEKCSSKDYCTHIAELEKLMELGKCAQDGLQMFPMKDFDIDKDVLPHILENGEVDTEDAMVTKKKQKKEEMAKATKEDLSNSLRILNQSNNFVSGQKFLLTYMKLNQKEKISIGHNIKDLIVSCTFRGVDCKASLSSDSTIKFMDYTVNTTSFGNCFTLFTSNEELGKSSLTGPEFGLSLVLNIQQSHYLRGLWGGCGAVGARVAVHTRETFPLMEEYGVDLAPGSLTSISMQMINILRHKYSGCVGTSWECSQYKDQLSEDHKSSYRYTISYCQRTCIQKTIQEQCGCSHPMYETSKEGYEYCDLVEDSQQRDCVTNIVVEYDIGERECDCFPPCDEVQFDKLVSSTIWPSKQAAVAFSELYGVSPEEVKDDYLKLDVYFMSLNVNTIKETARYTLTTFISALGGSLGVWVGLSVCMLFEVLEFAIDLGLSCFRKDK